MLESVKAGSDKHFMELITKFKHSRAELDTLRKKAPPGSKEQKAQEKRALKNKIAYNKIIEKQGKSKKPPSKKTEKVNKVLTEAYKFADHE